MMYHTKVNGVWKVYVTEEERPKFCLECPMKQLGAQTVICFLLEREIEKPTHLPKDCPLIIVEHGIAGDVILSPVDGTIVKNDKDIPGYGKHVRIKILYCLYCRSRNISEGNFYKTPTIPGTKYFKYYCHDCKEMFDTALG